MKKCHKIHFQNQLKTIFKISLRTRIRARNEFIKLVSHRNSVASTINQIVNRLESANIKKMKSVANNYWRGLHLPFVMEQWKKISLLLCIYGFFREFRPSEPFTVEFFIVNRNLTIDNITTSVFPLGTYSYMFSLIAVFLVTDAFRWVFNGLFLAIEQMIEWMTLNLFHSDTSRSLYFHHFVVWQYSLHSHGSRQLLALWLVKSLTVYLWQVK